MIFLGVYIFFNLLFLGFTEHLGSVGWCLFSVLENCWSLSFPIFLLLCSFFLFWVSSYINYSPLDFFSQLLNVLIPSPLIFFTLCLSLTNFSYLQTHRFFWCVQNANEAINNSSSYILVFIFRITIWLLFVVFIYKGNKFPICSPCYSSFPCNSLIYLSLLFY